MSKFLYVLGDCKLKTVMFYGHVRCAAYDRTNVTIGKPIALMAAHNVTRHLDYTPKTVSWIDNEYELGKLRQRETQEKRERVRLFLEKHKLDGIWLTQPANVTWYSVHNVTPQTATFLITRDHSYAITSIDGSENKLKSRMSELNGETIVYDQTKPNALWELLERVTSGLQIGCDTIYPPFRTMEAEVNSLRTGLTPIEQHRYRMFCQDCTTVLEEVAHAIQPGQSEKTVAAEIAGRCYAVGIRPADLFVSADSGLRRARHPLPGEQIIRRYAILVLEGTRDGLRAGLTRTVAFDRLPRTLEQRYYAAARLNALGAGLARPGILLGDVLRGVLSLYESFDHPSEWHARLNGLVQDYEHHTSAMPGRRLQSYQAFTLITGINGIQSQETLLLLPDGSSVLTANANWPVLEFETDNGITYRPDILRL